MNLFNVQESFQCTLKLACLVDRVAIKLLADGKKIRVFKSSGDEIKV